MSDKKDGDAPLEVNDVNIETAMRPHDSISDEEKAIMEEYSYVVDAVASGLFSRKKLPPSIDYNDLHSVGFDGLLKAYRRFDKTKNAQFKTYANIRVRGEMLDLIRTEWRARSSNQHQEFVDQIKDRVSQAIEAGLDNESKPVNVKNLLAIATTSYMVSLENVLDSQGDNIPDNQISIDNAYELNEEYHSLNTMIMKLPKEDMKFIDLFYRKGLTQKEIAVQMNTSEATISRHHHRIIMSLKKALDKEQ